MSDDLEPWPEKVYLLHPSIKSFAAMVTNPERREYVLADRIEQLEQDYYRWKMECEEFWRAREAKAVKALRECQEALRDHMKQYPHMAKGYTVDAEKNARTVLAELTSKGNP
jgi:hypothetical protein